MRVVKLLRQRVHDLSVVVEVMRRVERYDVDVNVRYIEPRDHEPYPPRSVRDVDGLAEALSSEHQMLCIRRLEPEPVVHLCDRNDEGVPRPYGSCGEEGNATIITPDEVRRLLTSDDLGKHRGHARHARARRGFGFLNLPSVS